MKSKLELEIGQITITELEDGIARIKTGKACIVVRIGPKIIKKLGAARRQWFLDILNK